MRHADYLIIGAGLAGSTCAYLLAKAGLDVTLVERLDLAEKSKLCAGLVTPRALRELDRIIGNAPRSLFKSDFTEMRCIADKTTVNLHGIVMKSVERRELDSLVLDRFLESGGCALDRVHVRDIDFRGRHVSSVRDGEQLDMSYDTLIAADGALSFVRRRLTGKAPDAILALEAVVPHGGAPLTMAYSDGFFGYSWYAPVGEYAKIGCCAYGGNPDLDEHLSSFARFMGVGYQSRRGAFIPTGSDVLLERDGVYFVGDAASLIAPPSGEGIFHALHSASMLARALVDGRDYPKLMRGCVREISRQYRLRDLFFDTKFMTRGIGLAEMTPYGGERAVKFALRHFAGYR